MKKSDRFLPTAPTRSRRWAASAWLLAGVVGTLLGAAAWAAPARPASKGKLPKRLQLAAPAAPEMARGVGRCGDEEAGVRALSLVPIVKMDLSNSVTDEQAICYLATGLSPGVHAPEPVEVLRNRVVPFGEVLADVAAGRITDAMTVAAVLRAHHMAVTGEIEAGLAAAMIGSK